MERQYWEVGKVAEIKSITRWWWAWNFDKEEEWLNQMADNGYALVGAKWIFYQFEKTEPGEYIIRIEYHKNRMEYINFIEELGAERISYYMGWNYYRRKSSLGEFDIFSDLKSKIEHLKGVERLILPLGVMNIGVGIMNSINITHIGFINLLLAAVLFYGYGCIKTKREGLEKERKLHE